MLIREACADAAASPSAKRTEPSISGNWPASLSSAATLVGARGRTFGKSEPLKGRPHLARVVLVPGARFLHHRSCREVHPAYRALIDSAVICALFAAWRSNARAPVAVPPRLGPSATGVHPGMSNPGPRTDSQDRPEVDGFHLLAHVAAVRDVREQRVRLHQRPQASAKPRRFHTGG